MIDLPTTRDLFYPSEPEPRGTATRIGKDLEADILLLDSGQVVARLQDGPEYLINTTVERYRESLEVVGEARDRFAAAEETDAEVEQLGDELRRIDPDALADPTSYWASILEQIEFEQF
jgi:SUKH-4 immunity protein of toxin-antitoxin system